MSVYFKMMKTFAACFLLISILNIPLYVVYMMNNDSRSLSTTDDLLFKTTLGNLASSIYIKY